MIIRTKPYTFEEIDQIIAIRADTERIQLAPDARRKLADIGVSSSLRHATQLLTPAQILAKARGGDSALITLDVIEEVQHLFLDAKTSARILLQNPGFMSQ
jgi:DNA helicase TIP49 (TBP-interacting protein)